MGGSKGYNQDYSNLDPEQYYDDTNKMCRDPASGRGNSFMQEQLSCQVPSGEQEQVAGGETETKGTKKEGTVEIADSGDLPPQLIPGIMFYEEEDRGILEGAGEWWKKYWKDWTVSLGGGDIQVRRAAELLYPDRNFEKEPLTDAEFDEIVAKLESVEGNKEILTKSLWDDYNHYGKKPGKSEEDRWKFAVAKHKGGHGVVGDAQQKVLDAGGDSNLWSEVSKHMDRDVVSFVENVWSYSLK